MAPYAYPTSVRKSSVYLPGPLKAELAALAGRTGRSEAELIRLAIERLVRSGTASPPAGTPTAPADSAIPPVGPGPRLVGVGVGPSDPDLVTGRALAVLRAADRVVAPSTGVDAIGRAEAVVREAAPDVGVDRLVIDIRGDGPARDASIAAAAAGVVAYLDRGELVAVALLGDPNVWSVFPRLTAAVTAARPGVPVETVPGIMAFQELAARASTVVADGEEELTLLTLGDSDGDGTRRLEPLLDDTGRSLVVYKGGRHLPAVAAALERHGRLGHAVLGENLGLPGGRTLPVAACADRPASYLATVIAPPPRPPSTTPAPPATGPTPATASTPAGSPTPAAGRAPAAGPTPTGAPTQAAAPTSAARPRSAAALTPAGSPGPSQVVGGTPAPPVPDLEAAGPTPAGGPDPSPVAGGTPASPVPDPEAAGSVETGGSISGQPGRGT